MITGEFDLSIGAVYVLAPYLMGMALERLEWPLWAALGVAILAGLTVGTINGIVTTRFKLPSFIATLGMMFFAAGHHPPCRRQRLFGGQGAGVHPGETFEAILAGQIFGPVHAQILWVIAIAIFAYFLLNRHRLGTTCTR